MSKHYFIFPDGSSGDSVYVATDRGEPMLVAARDVMELLNSKDEKIERMRAELKVKCVPGDFPE